MDYAKIENGEIVEGPKGLPHSWRNISGLHLASAERLKSLGWLPVSDAEKPAYNPATERLTVSGYTIGEESIKRNWTVAALSQEEIQRIADLAQRIADIQDLLPTWEQAATAIDNMASLADAKVIVRKMAKIIAWLVGVRPVQS